jgi:hypothetical protein
MNTIHDHDAMATNLNTAADAGDTSCGCGPDCTCGPGCNCQAAAKCAPTCQCPEA